MFACWPEVIDVSLKVQNNLVFRSLFSKFVCFVITVYISVRWNSYQFNQEIIFVKKLQIRSDCEGDVVIFSWVDPVGYFSRELFESVTTNLIASKMAIISAEQIGKMLGSLWAKEKRVVTSFNCCTRWFWGICEHKEIIWEPFRTASSENLGAVLSRLN